MNQKPHNRQLSNGRKVVQSAGRLSNKTTTTNKKVTASTASYHHGHAQGQSHQHSRPGSSASKKEFECDSCDSEVESDLSDMAGFLQYCATCEKQIISPGDNILYCSERCRRKDVGFSTPVMATPATPLTFTMPSYFDHYPPTNIVAPRSPTITRPISLMTLSDLSLSEPHHDDSIAPESPLRRESDPSRYPTQSRPESSSARLHRSNRSGTDSNLPSLVHSPSSSYGTVASNASYRALAPRHSQPFASDFAARKSIDLVIPAMSTVYGRSKSTSAAVPSSWKSGGSVKSTASAVTSYRVAEADNLSYQSCRVLMEEQRKADDRLRHMQTR